MAMVYDIETDSFKDNGLPYFGGRLGELIGPNFGFDVGPNDRWLSKIQSQDAWDYANSQNFERTVGSNDGGALEYWKAGVSSPEALALYQKQKSGAALTQQEQYLLNNPVELGRPIVAKARADWEAAGGDTQGGLGGIMQSMSPFLIGLGVGGIGSMLSGAATGAGGFIDAIGSGIGAGESITGALGAAGAGSGAMDWTDVLGEWPSYGDAASGAASGATSGLDPSWFPDFTNYSGQMSGIPGLEQSLTNVPLNLSAGAGLEATPWYQQLLQQAANDPLGTANKTLKALNSSGLLSGGMNALGGYLSGNAAQDAAGKTAAAQIEAARIAADAAKFKPIGVTTRFGQSDFTKDANGNVIAAGYNLTPDVKAQQDALMAQSGQMLSQYQNAPAAFAPMGAAGQRAMSLGNQYLATDPQAQALKYMQDQQALLATGRDRDMSQMLSGEFNRGTYGLATGATGMMGAANPRLEALINAQRQQDLGLAANATQGGMDYAKFGAGMSDIGGALTRGMYQGQTAAFDPYKTALGGAQTLEGLGQQSLTMGMDLGRQTSNAASGGLLAQGMVNAAQTQQNAAYSPWGTALMGGANAINSLQSQEQAQQQQQLNNQFMLSMLGNQSRIP